VHAEEMTRLKNELESEVARRAALERYVRGLQLRGDGGKDVLELEGAFDDPPNGASQRLSPAATWRRQREAARGKIDEANSNVRSRIALDALFEVSYSQLHLLKELVNRQREQAREVVALRHAVEALNGGVQPWMAASGVLFAELRANVSAAHARIDDFLTSEVNTSPGNRSGAKLEAATTTTKTTTRGNAGGGRKLEEGSLRRGAEMEPATLQEVHAEASGRGMNF